MPRTKQRCSSVSDQRKRARIAFAIQCEIEFSWEQPNKVAKQELNADDLLKENRHSRSEHSPLKTMAPSIAAK